eukprot:CAMPEP_0178385772 /NCGR_PEP_ID=MMETSP0689_2-20121128/8202_1 /TAXON_ID=160604 /ORGANISM="Amphidinium massartii, Strain CS-259" /LENGTH=332 /DNA_ID=CAMNT_0020006059 /DNA_START=9 /DNA_END=1004 /DNA_ORIENTATION=-
MRRARCKNFTAVLKILQSGASCAVLCFVPIWLYNTFTSTPTVPGLQLANVQPEADLSERFNNDSRAQDPKAEPQNLAAPDDHQLRAVQQEIDPPAGPRIIRNSAPTAAADQVDVAPSPPLPAELVDQDAMPVARRMDEDLTDEQRGAFCHIRRVFSAHLRKFATLPAVLSVSKLAVVSSSAALLSHRHGKEIDSHDVIIRLEDAPTEGYEDHVGSRTTLRAGPALWSTLHEGSSSGGSFDLDAQSVRDALLRQLFPDKQHEMSTMTLAPTAGFVGMLVAMLLCRTVDAYEMAPPQGESATRTYYANSPARASAALPPMLPYEHALWVRLASG